jgi:hypothetical protein
MGAIMGLDLIQVAATQEGELTWPGEMAGGGALFSFLPRTLISRKLFWAWLWLPCRNLLREDQWAFVVAFLGQVPTCNTTVLATSPVTCFLPLSRGTSMLCNPRLLPGWKCTMSLHSCRGLKLDKPAGEEATGLHSVVAAAV